MSSGEYSGETDATSILPSGSVVEESANGRPSWHGGLDFGLLVLRLIVGGVFLAHGARHLLGWFGGMGIDRFAEYLGALGFAHTGIFSYIAAWTELVGGFFCVLGLLTPLAAAGVLGVVVNAIVAVKWPHGFFAPDGFELEAVLAGAAFTLLFTGPGRIALDNGRRWFRYAPAFGFLFMLISAAAILVTLLVFRH
ncbi:MAG: DoxX family protein [Sciscionella sp.]